MKAQRLLVYQWEVIKIEKWLRSWCGPARCLPFPKWIRGTPEKGLGRQINLEELTSPSVFCNHFPQKSTRHRNISGKGDWPWNHLSNSGHLWASLTDVSKASHQTWQWNTSCTPWGNASQQVPGPRKALTNSLDTHGCFPDWRQPMVKSPQGPRRVLAQEGLEPNHKERDRGRN